MTVVEFILGVSHTDLEAPAVYCSGRKSLAQGGLKMWSWPPSRAQRDLESRSCIHSNPENVTLSTNCVDSLRGIWGVMLSTLSVLLHLNFGFDCIWHELNLHLSLKEGGLKLKVCCSSNKSVKTQLKVNDCASVVLWSVFHSTPVYISYVFIEQTDHPQHLQAGILREKPWNSTLTRTIPNFLFHPSAPKGEAI